MPFLSSKEFCKFKKAFGVKLLRTYEFNRENEKYDK
jgi:hypothetical protein